MTRPLRVEAKEEVYPITSQGDGREDIFWEDDDCFRSFVISCFVLPQPFAETT